VKVLIVPRGSAEAYYEFLGITTGANGDQLVVDRRVAERRQMTEDRPDDRRASDRRGPPPVTWERDGLIVLPRDSPPDAGKP
jgi:hypothetical protein